MIALRRHVVGKVLRVIVRWKGLADVRLSTEYPFDGHTANGKDPKGTPYRTTFSPIVEQVYI